MAKSATRTIKGAARAASRRKFGDFVRGNGVRYGSNGPKRGSSAPAKGGKNGGGSGGH